MSSDNKGSSTATKYYLIGYNLIQTLGWSFLFYQLLSFYIIKDKKSLYDTVKYSVIIFQNAAILEVFHACFKLVSSSPIITAQQISSRVVVVCGVLMVTQAARESVGLPLALFAWSITEIIRYANYTLSLVDNIPYFLKWLRYTTFIILYPIGVTGELLCMYSAQKEISKTRIFTIEMPNTMNFIFNYQYFLIFVMLLYIPLFPQMYLHMFSQRKKVLGKQPVKKIT